MTETMHKLVPGVLLRLSKMSATVHTAVPVLEFLAMLCHLPSVYKSFVEQEYISILAITVPYTNPFKFSHFVVSLAHHVTAAWFLRTKVAFRQKSAVDFIRKGLKANVSKASLELNSRSSFGSQEAPYRHSQPAAPPNDSDMRQRSSSLHEKVHPRRALNHSATYTLLDFHTELTLTCYDFMARYAFASTVSCPKPSPMSTFLFENGTSESWLLGHQIVTITTSGCCLIPHRRGLCGPCWAHAADLQESRAGMEGAGRGDVSGLEDDPRRKRHQTDVRVAAGPELPLVPLGATGKEDSRNHIHSSMASVSVGDPQSVGSEEARCTCWCQGWAQVTIRRATGDTSFVIRLENDNIAEPRPSLQDLCSMFVSELPATDEELVAGPSEGSSERLTNEEACLDSVSSSPQRHESGSGTPVRRVNSSPNMEAVRRRTGELAARRKEEENADTSPPAEPMQIAGNASSPPSPNKRELHPIALESGATWQQQQRLDDSTPGSPTTSRQLRHLSAPQGQGILTPGAGGGSTGSLSRHSHGLNPRFLFLQFYYTGQHGGEDPIYLEKTWQQQQRLDDSTPGSPTTSRQLRHLSAPQGQGILTPGAGGGSTGSLSRHSHGLNPRFLFLQFYYTGQHGGEDPIYLEKSSNLDRALKNLDLIPPYESHKIGVLYIPPGAKSCKDILCTKVTSTRYEQFLQGIGDVIDLTRTDKRSTFLGGLSTKGHDGRYAISWKDQVVQIIFHVATMMPTLPNDPNCNNKKAHIGNDKVVIVFNEGGTPYDLNTISGDCCLAAVDIQPLDHQSNLVNVRTRDAVGELLGHMEAKIASDESVPLLARLLAVHANMAGQVYHKSHGSVLFASNSLERLRQIRKLKAKSRLPPGSPRLSGEQEGGKAGNLEDFLSYV
ncbi:unnamed protein product [Cyprideis torosa]|uniref:Uncharacterized protein n=1 Tax=Cyprideis torosa TaxID=163714 RepID=A0A7R8WQH8_9CRUS|nr:unnamed protein product [Cyprideis torosa]CAG0903035.1 unnamed protein product [Cyprideis torosa]